MTSTSAPAGVVERSDRGSFLAWLCLTGAVLTVGGSLVIGLLTPVSSDTLFRYPFTPRGFVTAQILFVVNHLLLLAGVLALVRARAAQGRAWTAGIAVTVVGLLAWTACELWAITLVHRLTADPVATGVITGYDRERRLNSWSPGGYRVAHGGGAAGGCGRRASPERGAGAGVCRRRGDELAVAAAHPAGGTP